MTVPTNDKPHMSRENPGESPFILTKFKSEHGSPAQHQSICVHTRSRCTISGSIGGYRFVRISRIVSDSDVLC